jgi:excinuclease ABC subunit A
LEVLKRFIYADNTVLIIEHNLDVIKTADWIVDLGPEGGERGGKVIAQGSPEVIMKNPKSFTGKYLSEYIKGKDKRDGL